MNHDIYATLKERILFLEYPPGKILNEKVLADEFGVSRTPLREVLNRLEAEDLARVLPRTGTMVTEIEYQKMMHVFQVRFDLEALCGQLAAEHMAAEQLERLQEIEAFCAGLLSSKQKRALVSVDFQVREILHAAAGNPVLARISDQLYALTFRLWYMILDRGEWGEEVMALQKEVKGIYAIMSSRDAAAAGNFRKACLVEHLERIRYKFLGSTPKKPPVSR